MPSDATIIEYFITYIVYIHYNNKNGKDMSFCVNFLRDYCDSLLRGTNNVTFNKIDGIRGQKLRTVECSDFLSIIVNMSFFDPEDIPFTEQL